MIARILAVLVALTGLAVGYVYALGMGWLGEAGGPGVVTGSAIPRQVIQRRAGAQHASAERAGVEAPKQILFGDLHVHTTYSTDAFLMSLPMAGGDGAHPVADACDFARYCSALDFWSINDHAEGLPPQRWRETVDAIRQCNEVAGDPTNPDLVAFLGWEWSQVGTTPENHYGHKNVVLEHLDDARIAARPIAAGVRFGSGIAARPSTFRLGLLGLLGKGGGGGDLVRFLRDRLRVTTCPEGVAAQDLPPDCQVTASTPGELFATLEEWRLDALVIPHGTTWGFYTPLGATWDKQLARTQHDPARQTLVEVYSGHGSAEEFRTWREVGTDGAGGRSCPEPRADYLPACWRAGEIIRERCQAAGEEARTCEDRAAAARQHYVDADAAGHLTVPGAGVGDWGDAGQCRDCFLPAFNYRPRSSVQYMLALGAFDEAGDPLRLRFGLLSSSDNHTARPGTGYKEHGRREMTDMRIGGVSRLPHLRRPPSEPAPHSEPFDAATTRVPLLKRREVERQASFFVTGGLVAAHASGRSREAVWDALKRKEVYGTSGPRILLWFDLVDAAGGARWPMGSELALGTTPSFEVRGVGSLAQLPGCPEYATASLSPERLAHLCLGECYHPSNQRRRISRIEVVRIRPQATPDEPIESLIEDPWQVFDCPLEPEGCSVRFSDPSFAAEGRDSLYYVRAIEEPSLAVGADPLGCLEAPPEDDCLGEVEERAWSSPIFVDFE
jgi:hypothetical protein